jgi:hypothetical protein
VITDTKPMFRVLNSLQRRAATGFDKGLIIGDFFLPTAERKGKSVTTFARHLAEYEN